METLTSLILSSLLVGHEMYKSQKQQFALARNACDVPHIHAVRHSVTVKGKLSQSGLQSKVSTMVKGVFTGRSESVLTPRGTAVLSCIF